MSTYVPKPDIEGINSRTSQHPWLDLTILIIGFVLTIGIIYFSVGIFGEWAFTRISVKTEMKLFEGIKISDQFQKSNNKELSNLVSKLQVHVPFQLQVGVICEKTPNAFAIPGGFIILTSGLFEAIKTENGLAFVLGHEIGHFINRDHIRGLGRNLMMQVFGSLFGISMTDISSTNLLLSISTKTFSRGDEEKADSYGLSLLQKVYGHTNGADEFFAYLKAKEGTFDMLNSFMSTHPLSSDRYLKINVSQSHTNQKQILPEKGFGSWIDQNECP